MCFPDAELRNQDRSQQQRHHSSPANALSVLESHCRCPPIIGFEWDSFGLMSSGGAGLYVCLGQRFATLTPAAFPPSTQRPAALRFSPCSVFGSSSTGAWDGPQVGPEQVRHLAGFHHAAADMASHGFIPLSAGSGRTAQ